MNDKTLSDKNNLESLGNKVLLEKGINIRAADYRFEDKKKYYIQIKFQQVVQIMNNIID